MFQTRNSRELLTRLRGPKFQSARIRDRPERLFHASAGSGASAESEAEPPAGFRSSCLSRISCLNRSSCHYITLCVVLEQYFCKITSFGKNLSKIQDFCKEKVPKVAQYASVLTGAPVHAGASVLLLTTESRNFCCSCFCRSSCRIIVPELRQNHAPIDLWMPHSYHLVNVQHSFGAQIHCNTILLPRPDWGPDSDECRRIEELYRGGRISGGSASKKAYIG